MAFLIAFDVLKITVLFFLFYPNYWLCVSLLWLDMHFSWRAAPNRSATDLVWITLGQKWDSNAEAQWKAGPLWSGGQCAQICPKRPLSQMDVILPWSVLALNHFILLQRTVKVTNRL